MKYKVFIDGQEGTTGLQINSRIAKRNDVELLVIDEKYRKDANAKKELLNEADVAFLCLPDEAAKESASLVENEKTIVIDTSTAHRTASDWTYGLPELSDERRRAIAKSKRIANPGCHATGFIVNVFPLVTNGYISDDAALCCMSLTGYSGGGKKMIAQYEAENRPREYDSPRIYALTQAHKHIPEMTAVTGLKNAPVFCPTVCDFYCGMSSTVALTRDMFLKKTTKEELFEFFFEFYKGQKLITVLMDAADGTIAANELAGRADMRIYISGNDERMTVTSVFDNLGKCASGAAIQNMNIALGIDETYSLI